MLYVLISIYLYIKNPYYLPLYGWLYIAVPVILASRLIKKCTDTIRKWLLFLSGVVVLYIHVSVDLSVTEEEGTVSSLLTTASIIYLNMLHVSESVRRYQGIIKDLNPFGLKEREYLEDDFVMHATVLYFSMATYTAVYYTESIIVLVFSYGFILLEGWPCIRLLKNQILFRLLKEERDEIRKNVIGTLKSELGKHKKNQAELRNGSVVYICESEDYFGAMHYEVEDEDVTHVLTECDVSDIIHYTMSIFDETP